MDDYVAKTTCAIFDEKSAQFRTCFIDCQFCKMRGDIKCRPQRRGQINCLCIQSIRDPGDGKEFTDEKLVRNISMLQDRRYTSPSWELSRRQVEETGDLDSEEDEPVEGWTYNYAGQHVYTKNDW